MPFLPVPSRSQLLFPTLRWQLGLVALLRYLLPVHGPWCPRNKRDLQLSLWKQKQIFYQTRSACFNPGEHATVFFLLKSDAGAGLEGVAGRESIWVGNWCISGVRWGRLLLSGSLSSFCQPAFICPQGAEQAHGEPGFPWCAIVCFR